VSLLGLMALGDATRGGSGRTSLSLGKAGRWSVLVSGEAGLIWRSASRRAERSSWRLKRSSLICSVLALERIPGEVLPRLVARVGSC